MKAGASSAHSLYLGLPAQSPSAKPEPGYTKSNPANLCKPFSSSDLCRLRANRVERRRTPWFKPALSVLAWCTYGVLMVYVWCTYGVRMVCIWCT